MALNPDDQNPPVDGGGSGSGNGLGSGSGSGSGGTSGGGFWNTVQNIVGIGEKAGATVGTLTIDPNNPLTYNTRYNAKTDQIEAYNPVTGNWVPVTVVGAEGSTIDLSLFSNEELQSYLQSGTAIPDAPKMAKKKLTASTDTTTTKSKWWVWVLVAVAVGGGLFLVWKLAKKRSVKVDM